MYFVYLVECSDRSLYTGITTDVARRMREHAAGTGARYTRARKIRKLLYSERHANRSSASKREAEIKRWPRAKKLALVDRFEM
ncbi:MAG TPA: GIY-YIG nuclease family protein [Candidatus Paceibacterota bacterium]|nr:GIY-YIG nuclease family protein [Candidatus Paceibacterota bacterium]